MIRVQGLYKEFADQRTGFFRALDNVSFEVRAGEIVGVAGVEGNGQGELVEALTGLRRWAAGDVRLHGVSLKGMTPRAKLNWLYERSAYSEKDRNLYPVLRIR